jgi:protein-tyrosine phosphatase
MHDIVGTMNGELQRGACVYLHCHAGVGRTGTAVGCWLVEQGLTGPAALALIAHKRSNLARLAAMPRSPETDAQRDFVQRWASRRPAS